MLLFIGVTVWDLIKGIVQLSSQPGSKLAKQTSKQDKQGKQD